MLHRSTDFVVNDELARAKQTSELNNLESFR
jgi:hypothetical protein